MQIRNITVNNFKSLVEFTLDLSKFNCLIGLNGSGKSTVLQFIDFMSQLVRGDMKLWLNERSWKASDMNSRLTGKGKKPIDFSVELNSSEGQGGVTWKASFNTTQLHCTSERIETLGAVLEVQKGQLRITQRTLGDAANGTELHSEKISFSYEGSVLSQLRKETLPPSLIGFKNYIASVKSLDLLSPEYLRQRTRESLAILDGFDEEQFGRGVPMIPKPKSEAWLICALKRDAFQNCHLLESRSGNDNSPNSLKGELKLLLGDTELIADLCERLRDGRIDIDRIVMPSFAAFRDRLEEVI